MKSGKVSSLSSASRLVARRALAASVPRLSHARLGSCQGKTEWAVQLSTLTPCSGEVKIQIPGSNKGVGPTKLVSTTSMRDPGRCVIGSRRWPDVRGVGTKWWNLAIQPGLSAHRGPAHTPTLKSSSLTRQKICAKSEANVKRVVIRSRRSELISLRPPVQMSSGAEHEVGWPRYINTDTAIRQVIHRISQNSRRPAAATGGTRARTRTRTMAVKSLATVNKEGDWGRGSMLGLHYGWSVQVVCLLRWDIPARHKTWPRYCVESLVCPFSPFSFRGADTSYTAAFTWFDGLRRCGLCTKPTPLPMFPPKGNITACLAFASRSYLLSIHSPRPAMD